jgi:penicillin-insensitive murein DD-endopeptidase
MRWLSCLFIVCFLAGSFDIAEAARPRRSASKRTKKRRPVLRRLVNAVKLPVAGKGFMTPPQWESRGLRYGTSKLVDMVSYAAGRVQRELPGATLYVADLSLPKGGPTQWHRSHQTGCDVDLFYFAVDRDGRAAPTPVEMAPFDTDGVAWTVDEEGDPVKLVFDVRRNWSLVRAILMDPGSKVENLFVAHHIRDLLLEFALDTGEESRIVERAEHLLQQPGDSLPHDDHMHVRINCN